MALYDLHPREVATILAALTVYEHHFHEIEDGSRAHNLSTLAGERLNRGNIEGLTTRLQTPALNLNVTLTMPSPFYPAAIEQLAIDVPETVGWSEIRPGRRIGHGAMLINGVSMHLEALEIKEGENSVAHGGQDVLDGLYAIAGDDAEAFHVARIDGKPHVIFATPHAE